MELLEILRKNFWGGTVLQYFGALLILLATGILIIGMNQFLKSRERSKGTLDILILAAIRKALTLLLFSIGIYLVLKTLPFPESLERIFDQGFKALVVINIAYFFMKGIDLFVAFLIPLTEKTESKLDEQLLAILSRIGKIFIALISLLLIIQNFGYNITSLWAGLGIGGLAVALAARETLANFFGSITLFIDRPFQIGDLIDVEKHVGTVESVGFRSTRIRTLDGPVVIIPNSKLADATIRNIHGRKSIRKNMIIGLSYDSGYEKMKRALEIIKEILNDRKDLEESKDVSFREFGPHSVEIHVFYCFSGTDWNHYLKTEEEINLEILRRFEGEEIAIALPSRTIYVKGAGLPEETYLKGGEKIP